MQNEVPKAPWLVSYDEEVPKHLVYSEKTMAEVLEETVEKYPDLTAYEFMGSSVSYRKFWGEVEQCAKAFRTIGIREGDCVTICLPNMPQAMIAFYAVNLVGAIANMIHPLSAESEIAFYLRTSHSMAAITLDQFYPKFATVRDIVELPHLIITSISDALSGATKLGYTLTEGRKIKAIPAKADVILWNDFLKRSRRLEIFRVKRSPQDPAVILYSGGTTGTTKGILLSNYNFNAFAAQIIATNPMFRPGDKMLAILPMFHGFGLGVSIHSMMFAGGSCLLIPRFTPKTYVELLRKHHPNFIAGVPTLFESLLRVEEAQNLDLSALKGVYSGGDSLSVELKKRLDTFLHERGSKVGVREGYGMTECVSASCLTPMHKSKEGSIGLPFPDTYFKIVRPGTEEEVPYGEEGEICIAGPSVMLRYVNLPEETAQTLRKHKDGYLYIHTGDLGTMDEEGFVYFRQRIKRMIVTNGYNVYPSQLENILDAHEYVHMSCVIGLPDAFRQQKVKAFIVLKPGYVPSEACRSEIRNYCRKHIAKYALPEIEFREELPKTKVGKIAYRVLEEEELAKRQQKEKERKEQEQQQEA